MREATFYLLAALLLWLVVHKWLHKRLAHRVIAGWPSSADVRCEMVYSFGAAAARGHANAGVHADQFGEALFLNHAIGELGAAQQQVVRTQAAVAGFSHDLFQGEQCVAQAH